MGVVVQQRPDEKESALLVPWQGRKDVKDLTDYFTKKNKAQEPLLGTSWPAGLLVQCNHWILLPVDPHWIPVHLNILQ